MSASNYATNVYRLLGVALWVTATALFIAGARNPGDPTDWYAWGVYFLLLGCACVAWLLVEHIIRREAERATRRVAIEVGRTVGSILIEHEVRELHSVRD